MRQVFTVLVVVAASSCASLGKFASSDEVVNVKYGEDADTNMKRGDDALDSKNYAEAERYYDYVKSKYPFLEAAKIAELRMGDTDYERERFLEARDRYTTFVKLHPTHSKVDYAAYRSALTYYKDIPSDFFLLPPSREKDQANLRSAQLAMADFLRTYPNSGLAKEALTILNDVKRRLAEHEMYVAAFYRKRDKWPAVVNRLQIVDANFSGIGFDEEVAFGLHEAFLKLNDPEHAKAALRTLVQRAPDSSGAKKAKAILGPNG